MTDVPTLVEQLRDMLRGEATEAADLIEQQERELKHKEEVARRLLKENIEQGSRIDALTKALESIMHARGDPTSSVTNMGRAMMREIAAAALKE
jgi:hypothetical protein